MKEMNDQDFIPSLLSRTEDPVLQNLIRGLVQGVPHSAFDSIDPEWLFIAAKSSLELLKMPKQSSRVSVMRDESSPDEVVLQVIHNEIPFLVDSLSNALKQQDLEIQLILHPTLHINRDKNGAFLNITETEQDATTAETILQFYIGKWLDDSQCKQLEEEIASILECIDMSVRDWLSMRDKMSDVVRQMSENADADNLEQVETQKFLEWLVDKNFIFLAYFESVLDDKTLKPIEESIRGLLCSKTYPINQIDMDSQYTDGALMFIRKWDYPSVVHRSTHMDWLVIKRFDHNGRCVGAYNFLGLFTSAVYYQSVMTIPLIRIKTHNVVKRYGYPEASHNGKELVTALEAFPRGELLQMSEDELFETATGIVALQLTPRVRLFLRQDRAEKFISCIIFLPRNRFSTEVRLAIEKMLCTALNGVISKQYVQINESQLARVQLLLQTVPRNIPPYSIDDLEDQITHIVNAWSDDLYEILVRKSGKQLAKLRHKRFNGAFDIKYTSTFSAKQAIHDIELIELALSEERVQFDIYITPHVIGGRDSVQLKIYSPHNPLLLSVMLPKIEHVGFKAFDVVNYEVTVQDSSQKVFISHFRLLPASQVDLTLADLTKKIETAFYKIWNNDIEDDRFNSLILYNSLIWRESLLLRIYFRYLKQLNFPHDLNYVVDVLIKYPKITTQLVQLFNDRFDPVNHKNHEGIERLVEDINQTLTTVDSIAEEQVLKSYLSAMMATKRTNFFQHTATGEHKGYISLKLRSSEIIGMPEPKPYAESYVYCPTRFEGVHLRGNRISRGGLRWSDRPDFRTEVLGLMKAQMTKNSVIVPSGSKGGFLLKKVSPADGREAFMNEGVTCYKMFLSGILDLTDNVIDGKVLPPAEVVRYDDDDPYLVVAADKGTATFSDYANSVSADYKFWLGDAFASGGSAGYDHKKMAITARGAWISVEHHFIGLGIDISKQPFSVVGIGDMSGDVFGNGMLLSQNIKLIGAFNHIHIFLDPNPDPAQSYKERTRLFALPRSQWSDYDAALISQGGGVFERSSKYIEISPQVAAVLQINNGRMTPEELISAILKAPVDLLWNGGIGTYIKAETELNEQIGDKTNDALRVNGKDLRCKVIGEGGNLGMTQLGRIEYAHQGGRLNTDAIDNSAGVDCSDHEVNIKIALNQLMHNGTLNLENRNKLLDDMTEAVAQLVLKDNYMQNKLITAEEISGDRRISVHAWLIRYLENRGELDRELEFLPSPEALVVLESEGKCLTRPEISVLIAYAKNSAFKMLSTCLLTKDPYLQKDLLNYFPKVLKQKYKDTLLSHQLANEILVTVLVNEFINALGCTAFHQLVDAGYTPQSIIKAYVTIRDLFDIPEYWRKVEVLNGQVSFESKIQVMWEIQRLIHRNIRWMLRHNCSQLNDIASCINLYQSGIKEFRKLLNQTKVSCSYSIDYDEVLLANVPTELRSLIIELYNMYQALDIIKISQLTNNDMDGVATAYSALGKKMHIDWILMQTRRYTVVEYIDKIAMQSIVSEIEDLHTQLTTQVLAFTKEGEYCTILDNARLDEYSRFIGEMKVNSSAWIGMLVLTLQRIREFLNT